MRPPGVPVRLAALAAVLACAAALAGCGQTGPLYLPPAKPAHAPAAHSSAPPAPAPAPATR